MRRLTALHSGPGCMVPLRSFPVAPLKLCAWGSSFYHCMLRLPAIKPSSFSCRLTEHDATILKMGPNMRQG